MKKLAPRLGADGGIDRFFELSSDLLCIANVDGYFLRISDSWTRLLGYSREELLSRPFVEFVHPDDRIKTSSAVDSHAQGENVTDFINRYRCKSGEYRTLSWRSNAPDNVGLIYAVARDVTEDERIRQQLTSDRARLRAVMDTIPDLIFIKDRNFRYVGCNKPFETFMAHREDELLGRDDFQFFPPSIAQSFRNHDDAMFQSGAPRRNEERVVYPDGRRRYLDTVKTPFRDENGTVVGLVGISRDITEQARLRDEVNFLGTIVNQVRDPILALRPDIGFAISYVNAAGWMASGLQRDGAIGSHPSRFIPELTDARLTQFLDDLRGNRPPPLATANFVHADGTATPTELRMERIVHDGTEYLICVAPDTSERHRNEKALLEREALYRASIETTADGFWLADGQGRLLDANSTYAALSGYSVDELVGMSIMDLDATETPEDTRERIERLMEFGSDQFETLHRRKDGSIWDVEVSTVYSPVEGGRIFAFLRDMRRRRRADAVLKARLRLAEMARTGDMDRLITELLDSAERMTASSIGFFHFVDDAQREVIFQAWSTNTVANMCTAEGKGGHYAVAKAGVWADCLRQGKTIVINDYANHDHKGGMPDGHATVSRLLSIPIAGKNGIAAVIGLGNKSTPYDQDDIHIVEELATVAMDIVNGLRADQSQRDLAQALAATALQWTAAMDSFEGGIAILDQDHRLLRANAAFFALTNSTPEARIGQPMHCLSGTVTTPLPDCPFCDLVARRAGGRVIVEADHPANPAGRPLEIRLAIIGGDHGGGESMVLSLYDLTEVRAQEHLLRRTVEELTATNAELGQFTKVATHDLQEPTRRQILYGQMLQRKLDSRLEGEARTYLNCIVNDALRMRDMVRGLALYDEAGRTTQSPEPTDMDSVLDEVVVSLDYEIQAVGAQISSMPLGEVLGHRARLRLLLGNLISNALRFRRVGIAPRIVIAAKADGGFIEYSVADNGVGVPQEYRDKVFTLFGRYSGTPGESGSGLGLAQCKRVVEQLGGTIHMDGNESGGATVRFSLPRVAP